MRKVLIFAALPVVAFFLAAAASGQAKKAPDNKATVLDTTDADYGVLAQFKGVSGKIVSLSPSGTSMTLRVEYQVQELKDPNKAAKVQNPPNYWWGVMTPQQIQIELAKIQNIKNPATQQLRLIQLMNKVQNQQQRQQIQQIQWVQKQLQQAANNYKTVTYAKEFDLQIVPKVHVAKKSLGMEYDDKGNIKEYKPEELKKLKDDVYIDFFKSKMDEVTPGLTIWVVLAKPKEPAKEKPKVADPKDKADPDKANPVADPKVDDKNKKPVIDIKDILDPKVDDKDKKPGVIVNDPLNPKGPLQPGALPPASKGPVVQGIIILSETGLDTSPTPPEKKKKKKD